MHFVVRPLAVVVFTIRPVIATETTNFILSEFTFICRAVSESKLSLTLLLTINILALISSTIRPRLHSQAVLLIILPISIVVGAVGMGVSSFTMSFIVDPLAIINVSICMNEFTISIGLVVLPLSIVFRAIRPGLLAHTISEVIHPLTSVNGLVLKVNWPFQNSTEFIRLLTTLSKLLHYKGIRARTKLVLMIVKYLVAKHIVFRY